MVLELLLRLGLGAAFCYMAFFLALTTTMSGYDLPTTGDPTLALAIYSGFSMAGWFAGKVLPSRPARAVVALFAMFVGFQIGHAAGTAPLPEKFVAPDSAGGARPSYSELTRARQVVAKESNSRRSSLASSRDSE